MEENRKDKKALRTYYGMRGNEIVKIEEFDDVVEVNIILIEDDEGTITSKRYCTLPRTGVEIKIDGMKLSLKADIRELLKTPKDERADICTGVREDVLWENPEDYYDLSDEYEAEDYRQICSIKETIKEIKEIPKDELYDMEVTVINEGVYSRFNCMRSMEDGYERMRFRRIDDSSEGANPIRKINAKYLGNESDDCKYEWEDVGAEYMTLLRELVDADDMGDISVDDIKFAMMFAFDHRRGYDWKREAERTDLINAIRNLLDNRKTPRETKTLWARGLFEALNSDEVRDFVRGLTLRQYNYVYYQAMKQDVDETPSSKLMNWYKEGLEKSVGYSQESKMYNRLAYFYLHHYALSQNLERAKAYFLAMERRGIERDNPYEMFYKNDNHDELVDVLLNNSHSEDFDLYIEEYFKKIKAKYNA